MKQILVLGKPEKHISAATVRGSDISFVIVDDLFEIPASKSEVVLQKLPELIKPIEVADEKPHYEHFRNRRKKKGFRS